MVFNSFEYLIFFMFYYLVYFIAGRRFRWLVLLMASLSFYLALKAPYLLGVLLAAALTSYWAGLLIHRSASAGGKQRWLLYGILLNVGILISMKYLPFFFNNLNLILSRTGFHFGLFHSNAIVSIGVSYYTFQAISYLIDIYLGILEPETSFGIFLLYMAFFPKLFQGPIERAGALIPQLNRLEDASLSTFRSGIFLIAMGLFKKCVMADRIGLFVDPIFNNVHACRGLSLLLAVYAYAFQIYFDFSGYTDMALGSAKLFNINLTPNFNRPYLAQSVAEFWRRWHISFSSWILNYIFKPLQMHWRDRKSGGTAAALVVTFLVSGIWHGASWGFVVWGLLHGLYLGCSVFYKPYQKKIYKILKIEPSRTLKVWHIIVTFNLICLGWIFFRANTIADAWYVVSHLSGSITNTYRLTTEMEAMSESGSAVQEALILLGAVALYLTLQRTGENRILNTVSSLPMGLRFPVYYSTIMALLVFGYFAKHPFAYVRF